MLPLRFARLWNSVSTLLLLGVLAAAVLPIVLDWPDDLQFLSWLGGLDKWAHAVTFAMLAVWFSGQYRPASYWRIAAGLFGFGVLIELCQRMLAYRSAEWLDIGADAAGIFIGLGIALAGIGGWCLRLESWYLSRGS